MNRAKLFAAACFIAAALPAVAQTQDPKAVELARSVMQAMGGEKGWDSVHFVRYDFIVTAGGQQRANRSHLWDKWSGRYRYESKTKEGKSQIALFNVNDKQGAVYVDGARLEGAAADEAVKGAYGSFINDMYWLAMPWKWLDKGVTLKYLGPHEREGKKYEVVELSFNSVGLTPGDKYQAFVAPDTKMMMHWEYTLQGGQTGAWDWQYARHGSLMLASNHVNPEGTSINMGDVAVFDNVDDAYFTDPAKMISQLR